MDLITALNRRLAEVNMDLYKEEELETPPPVPAYAQNMRGFDNTGITEDNAWTTKFKEGDTWPQIFCYGSWADIACMSAPTRIDRKEKPEWEVGFNDASLPSHRWTDY